LAVIQAALIVGFFMRLRYDYRFLSVVFFGTGILVFSFFALTMTDLTNRGHTIQDERIQVSALVADVRSADILAPVHTADAITVLIARHKAAKKAAELKDKPQVAPDVKKPEYRPPPPDVLALGQQKFAQNCTLCHGAKGMGDGPGAKGMRVTPSAFGKGEFRYGKTFDDIMQIIKNGVVQNGMTSYGWMPENEREALTYYILHLDHLGQ
jgi:mono/diheme cytochrome c family protein